MNDIISNDTTAFGTDIRTAESHARSSRPRQTELARAYGKWSREGSLLKEEYNSKVFCFADDLPPGESQYREALDLGFEPKHLSMRNTNDLGAMIRIAQLNPSLSKASIAKLALKRNIKKNAGQESAKLFELLKESERRHAKDLAVVKQREQELDELLELLKTYLQYQSFDLKISKRKINNIYDRTEASAKKDLQSDLATLNLLVENVQDEKKYKRAGGLSRRLLEVLFPVGTKLVIKKIAGKSAQKLTGAKEREAAVVGIGKNTESDGSQGRFWVIKSNVKAVKEDGDKRKKDKQGYILNSKNNSRVEFDILPNNIISL